MRPDAWTAQQIDTATAVLRSVPFGGVLHALPTLTKQVGREVTYESLRSAFRGRGLPSPSTFCATPAPPEPDEPAAPAEAPTDARVRVAVISDLHYGSSYCSRDALTTFIGAAYAQGVRLVLCPGDLLEGNYRHARFELSHHGLDEQALDLAQNLPALPGLSYHAITGNHEETFAKEVGISVGKHIERFFAEHGRTDLRFYEDRAAMLDLDGALVELWHPGKGGPVPQLRKKIASYPAHRTPKLLLAGHWHQFAHLYESGVHAIACPTFQGGQGPYGRMLGGGCAVGGLVLSWRAGSGMTDFGIEFHDASARLEPEAIHKVTTGARLAA